MTTIREYQRSLIAAINAEMGARQWSRKYLAARAGIPIVTADRFFALKRDLNVTQLAAIAAALGVSVDHLASEAVRWAELSAKRVADSTPAATIESAQRGADDVGAGSLAPRGTYVEGPEFVQPDAGGASARRRSANG